MWPAILPARLEATRSSHRIPTVTAPPPTARSALEQYAPGVAPSPPAPGPETGSETAGKSYEKVLKSSVLVGGSSMLNIGLGIIRTKALAVLLGPSGVGVLGVYTNIVEMT